MLGEFLGLSFSVDALEGVTLLGLGGIAGVSVVAGRVRRPEGEVVSEQLHDKRRVLVAVFVEGVELSDGFVERLKREENCFRSKPGFKTNSDPRDKTSFARV